MSFRFLPEKTRTIAITTRIALEHSSLKKLPGERQIVQKRLSDLRQAIKVSRQISFKWAKAKILESGDVVCINGQHSSFLLSGYEEIPSNCFAIIEEYECDTINDAIELHAQFDRKISTRTSKELHLVAQLNDPEFCVLDRQKFKFAVSALVWWHVGWGYQNKTSDTDKIAIAKKEKDFVVWACNHIGKDKTAVRVGVFYAAIKTYRDDRSKAELFWDEVQTGSNPNIDSGSRQLQKILWKNSSVFSKTKNSSERGLTAQKFAEICLSAWENWKKNKNIKNIKTTDAGLARFLKFNEAGAVKEQ